MIKQKRASRKDEIELRFKVICGTEIRNTNLTVYVQLRDSTGEVLTTPKFNVCNSTEIDAKVPIFKELFRPERNPADTTLSAQI